MKTKASFKESTALKNVWNKIVEWNGLKIATVLWHANKEWKIVDTLNFNLISDRNNKSYILQEFHTQEDLWAYIKENNLDT